MNANFIELQHLLGLLSVNFDIIVLTETWSKDSSLYNNCLPNYFLVASGQSNKSGGVFIFCSKKTVNLIA